jgi:hypothetical protein
MRQFLADIGFVLAAMHTKSVIKVWIIDNAVLKDE